MQRNVLPYGQKMRKAEKMKDPQFSSQVRFHLSKDPAGGPTSSRGSIVPNTEFHSNGSTFTMGPGLD